MRGVMPLLILALAGAVAVSPAGLAAQGDGAGSQRRTQPPRAQRAGEEPPKGTAAIRGFVVAADTGTPIRRAQVRASSAESRDTRVTTTDDQGRFELKELLGGRYTVSASKGGFVTLQYGQRRPSEQGTPLDVAAGQALEKVGIALPRGSVIAGRIVDEFGEPVTGAIVMAMRYGYAGGTRRLMNGGGGGGANDRTDDQGSFRLFGLTPGEYVVSASLRGGPMAALDRDDDGGTSGYAPTYYPGTPSAAEAQRIRVGVGEEAPGVTFALTLTRLVKVSGRAVTSQGTPVTGATVLAIPADAAGGGFGPAGGRGGAVGADGSFDIPGLAPGAYVIAVRPRGRAGDGESGRAAVVVGSSDLSGVTVITSPGATLAGRIVTDQGTPPPFGPNDVRVTAMPANPADVPMMFGGGPPRTGDDFTFEVRGVAEPRLLRVGPPAGWSLKAIELEGQDVSDAPIDPRAGDIRGLRVVLTQGVTDLSGLVSDDRGDPVLDATVVVFPADEALWGYQSRYVRTARPDQQGRYQLRGLPPYERYLVAVVQSLEDGQASDPEFLATLKPAARGVSLGPAESKSFDVRR
jgi:hypothetical protein